jgi:hypothetical protein
MRSTTTWLPPYAPGSRPTCPDVREGPHRVPSLSYLCTDAESRRLVARTVRPGPSTGGACARRPRAAAVTALARCARTLARGILATHLAVPRPTSVRRGLLLALPVGARRLSPARAPLAPGILTLRVLSSGFGALARLRPRFVLVNPRPVLASPLSHLLRGPGCVGRGLLRKGRHGDSEHRGCGHGNCLESDRHCSLPLLDPVTRPFRASSIHRRRGRSGRHIRSPMPVR